MKLLSKLSACFRSYKDLHEAAENGDLRGVKRLIRCGADLNEQDRTSGYAPLHAAVSSGNIDLVRFLIENGARLDVDRAFYGTPLRLAVRAKNISLVKLLLEKGADPNWSAAHRVENLYGNVVEEYVDPVPLLDAVQDGSREIVELLLQHGADPTKASSRENLTPINCVKDEGIKHLLHNGKHNRS